jgi:hypothetical protein
MKYRWRAGARETLDAQSVGEHLETLRAEHGGLTAHTVLGDATSPRSPLHDGFEWDDGRAAHEHRLHQARMMLAHIAVVVSTGDDDSRDIRAFVVVNRGTQDRYESISVVMRDPVLRHQVLMRALRELESWERRYHDLREFGGVRAAITKTQRTLA